MLYAVRHSFAKGLPVRSTFELQYFSPYSMYEINVCFCWYNIDIDQDGLISREDMYVMLDMITDEPLNESVKKKVVDEVRLCVLSKTAS